jgi:lipoyl(octanoyl) transferase
MAVREVWTIRLGLIPYEDARRLQAGIASARNDDRIPDVLLLLEHPPVYTKGRRSTTDELPMGEDWYRRQGIDVVETDRGGRVTYHGPGQLVGYPIVSLRALADRAAPGREAEEVGRVGVHEYIRGMERAIIGALGDSGVEAEVVDGLTGVWTPERRKIGSIGIHVSRGVTTHGFAVNVNNDLQPFEWIVPCGIEYVRMTSLSRELGNEQSPAEFGETIARRFAEVFGLEAADVEVGELTARV